MVAISQIIPLLPVGYEEKCYNLGIIQRQRMIKSPADLMLLCLFHLINGCTLMEMSEVGRLLKIGEFSDVAFMKKFEKCTEWFNWISEHLIKAAVSDFQKPSFLENYRVVAVDASDVVEKGRSGQLYRLHYSIDIFNMNSIYHKITKQDVGETLLNFEFRKGDLIIGDRIYGTINGINHCKKSEADYILRLRTNCFKIYDENEKEINILSKISDLDYEESTDFSGFVKGSDKLLISVRICAKKKSKEACENALKKLKRRATKKQHVLSDKTVLFNEYIVLITSLPKGIAAEDVLETYRYRWQVECYFKRLKSIMDFGDLPKKREGSSLSWLNGKIMVALMIEMFMSKGFFSPDNVSDFASQHLERNKDN